MYRNLLIKKNNNKKKFLKNFFFYYKFFYSTRKQEVLYNINTSFILIKLFLQIKFYFSNYVYNY